MNALIDLTRCREHMVITINQKEFKIKLAGTIKNPYFCGKDVCDILEQKDSKYALKTHVSPKYKKELSGFYPVNYDHNLGKKEITFREGQVVYVSEPGLYSLIMGSKTPFALAFQELVYETILPSIREYGSYQVETRLSHVMEQLAIKEKSEEDLHIQLEQEKEARLKAERKAIRVNKFMRRIVVKEHKLEWIYIATNDQYPTPSGLGARCPWATGTQEKGYSKLGLPHA